MSLKEKIFQDFKKAFKEKDMKRKDVLAMVQSEIKNREIELGVREQGLGDEEVVAVLSRAVKQRKDSIGQFEEGGREELAQKEREELEIIQSYLPEQMSDEEIERQVALVVEKSGAKEPSDLGKVMGIAMAELKGKADGTKVREIAQKILSSQK